MAAKRYIPFILVNIVVSAAVVLGVLTIWERNQTEQHALATATSVAATAPVATAEAIAAASTAPTPTEAPSNLVRHIVQAGETLGSIAGQYDLPWEDIAAFNGLADPNFLEVGDELIIPVGGIPTATPEPTPIPTSAEPPTPIPTEPPAAGEARVVIRDITGAGNLDSETVTIANEGSRQIQLLNWRLEDGQGNVYTFKPFILFGEGANVTLYTQAGTDTTFALYWGLTFPVWETGETATLRDSDGTARHTLNVP